MAPTQDALYADIDLALSWSERELPERERTKHVHRLHPYVGKFIPQLVEALLGRYFRPGHHVLDPFGGSGTTVVQALESGLDATAVELAAFNCLLMRAKTARYNLFSLEHELRDACARLDRFRGATEPENEYLRAWYAPEAAAELLFFRSLVEQYEHADSCGSCSPGPPARPGAPPTPTSRRRGCRSSTRTGATSTGAGAARWRRRGSSCGGTRSTRSRA